MTYAHELAGTTHDEQPAVPHSRDEGDPTALHTENLYDENGDVFGNTINYATGETFDNSTETDETILHKMGHVVTEDQIEIDPALGDLDATDKWLAQVEADPTALEAATEAWLKHRDK